MNHPTGTFNGTVYGQVNCILVLTTSKADVQQSIAHFHQKLCNWGHSLRTIDSTTNSALQKYRSNKQLTLPTSNKKHTFPHLTYHSDNPTWNTIQRAFQDTIMHPNGEPSFPTLENKDGYSIKKNRLIVCYHKTQRIKNSLFPYSLYQTETICPSIILNSITNNNADWLFIHLGSFFENIEMFSKKKKFYLYFLVKNLHIYIFTYRITHFLKFHLLRLNLIKIDIKYVDFNNQKLAQKFSQSVLQTISTCWYPINLTIFVATATTLKRTHQWSESKTDF